MFYRIPAYREDLEQAKKNVLSPEGLKDKSFLITGASGLIGSFLVDLLRYFGETSGLRVGICAAGRNPAALEERFSSHVGKAGFRLLRYDVNDRLDVEEKFDFIVHAAGNSSPGGFSADPVGTITANVFGVYNLMEYARGAGIERFLYVSSGEVYGQGAEGLEAFEESYSGYVDSTSPRSCYPNGKRAAETLGVSYFKQYGVDFVIVRPCHTYGPTALGSDNRASAQFVNDALAGKDIVMKSPGLQRRSYCYVADSVSALLSVLLRGKSGEAYNIANSASIVTIREMAETLAAKAGRKVVFDVPEEAERQGYNPVTQSVLASKKLEALGWKGSYSLAEGMEKTIRILRARIRG